jgi:hypothetical protein
MRVIRAIGRRQKETLTAAGRTDGHMCITRTRTLTRTRTRTRTRTHTHAHAHAHAHTQMRAVQREALRGVRGRVVIRVHEALLARSLSLSLFNSAIALCSLLGLYIRAHHIPPGKFVLGIIATVIQRVERSLFSADRPTPSSTDPLSPDPHHDPNPTPPRPLCHPTLPRLRPTRLECFNCTSSSLWPSSKPPKTRAGRVRTGRRRRRRRRASLTSRMSR